jgi:GNAT superfamily N-acetyltransferase
LQAAIILSVSIQLCPGSNRGRAEVSTGITDSDPPVGPANPVASADPGPMRVIDTFTDDQVHQLHALYQQEWWTRGRTFRDSKKCVECSQICIGLIDGSGSLQGFARVLTDYVFKALVFDVIVASNQRGTGLGKKLLSLVLNHPQLRPVKHVELYCLPEMSGFYAKLGFSSDVGQINLMRLENR